MFSAWYVLRLEKEPEGRSVSPFTSAGNRISVHLREKYKKCDI